MNEEEQMQLTQKSSNSKLLLLVLGVLAVTFVGVIAGVVGYKIGEDKSESNMDSQQQLSSRDGIDDNVTEYENNLDNEESDDKEDNSKASDNENSGKDLIDTKTIVLEKMGYKLVVPKDWNIKSEVLNVNVVHAILVDSNGNEYHLDTMCQLGDCSCEWRRNNKTLYEVNFLDKNVDLTYQECTDEFIQEKLYSEIIFRTYTPNSKYELIGFRFKLQGDISYEEAKQKYAYLIDVIESIEMNN